MGRPLEGHGLHVDVPAGWDARIRRRAEVAGSGTTRPMLHAGSFPLPVDRGDYGSGAVESMSDEDVFVALVEFGPEAVGTALFDHDRPTTVRLRDLRPDALQRTIAGQRGAQWFFHVGDRAFCLYVVLGGQARAAAALAEVGELLAGLRVD